MSEVAFKRFGGAKLEFASYTGSYSISDITMGGVKYRVLRLISSGTLKLRGSGKFDIFCVGGGGSGFVIDQTAYSAMAASGGAGGYTKTLLDQKINGNNSYTVNIGHGGANLGYFFANGSYAYRYGQAGGTTSVVLGSATLVSAAGGGSGYEGSYVMHAIGGDGGSGAGGCNGGKDYAYAGGSDGANGESYTTDTYNKCSGAGQGTTTRAFGESDGELFASGGGSAYYDYDSDNGNVYEVVKEGGSGAGPGLYTSTAQPTGADATQYGCGGGGVAFTGGYSGNIQYRCGSGMQGIVLIRWKI